jgi:hypothetical protein
MVVTAFPGAGATWTPSQYSLARSVWRDHASVQKVSAGLDDSASLAFSSCYCLWRTVHPEHAWAAQHAQHGLSTQQSPAKCTFLVPFPRPADRSHRRFCVSVRTGQEVCNSECVDLKSSKNHCSKCGQACPPNHACVDGECVCPEGQLLLHTWARCPWPCLSLLHCIPPRAGKLPWCGSGLATCNAQ